ncbi:MAG: Holliday junction resolvase RuvX [Bacilli bacterium]
MRLMGVDYGDVRIGIALSDPLLITAQTFEVIDRRKTRRPTERIAQIVIEQSVDMIVVGLPVNMNGTMGERVTRTQEFAKELEELTGLQVKWMDERLTTVRAEQILIEGDVRRKKRKSVVDKVAAALILQTYLDAKGRM